MALRLTDEQLNDLSHAIERYLDGNLHDTPPWTVQDLVNLINSTLDPQDPDLSDIDVNMSDINGGK